jgi:hypothetical protein
MIVIAALIVGLIICQLLTWKIMWAIYYMDVLQYTTPYPKFLYFLFHFPYVNFLSICVLYIIVADIYSHPE